MLFNTLKSFALPLTSIDYPFLCSSKERTPRKSLFPRSLAVFREFQNSPALGGLKQAEILFPQHSRSPGAFQGIISGAGFFKSQRYIHHRLSLHNALRGDICGKAHRAGYSIMSGVMAHSFSIFLQS